ncbi:MAG TPA: FkbM family methyltransferase [Phycisphaerales bacterium]|nr:FkbM family methyltransferase [Phycisphaerales bacterium]
MTSFTTFLRRARRSMHQVLGQDLRTPLQTRCASEFLGSEYGGWNVCPTNLSASSTVYSVGVGQDISFDLALISRFNLAVHAFDPTPKSIQWVKSQTLPPNFIMHEYGLAEYDGVAHFTLPRADFVSFSMVDHQGPRDASGSSIEIDAPVFRLSTILDKLNHDHIDLLKMDIEGAELAVIRDLPNLKIPIRQLLIEFHHRIGNRADLAAVREALATLNSLGFRLFAVSPVGKEFSFIHQTK